MGRFALLTGATGGISQELANLLAVDGWNSALVSRRTAVFQSLACWLSDQHGVQARHLAADVDRTAQ